MKVTYKFPIPGRGRACAGRVAASRPITGDGDFAGRPAGESGSDNIFGFETTFEGKPVDSTLHQYAFALGVDQTALLKIA